MVFRQLTVIFGLLFITSSVLGMPFDFGCSFFCNNNYHPVCGELPNGDFQPYPNNCELELALCKGDAVSGASDIKCGIEREPVPFFSSSDGFYSGIDDGTSFIEDYN